MKTYLTFFRDERAVKTTASPCGVKSLMSWERLAKLLDGHECAGRNERVVAIEATDDGIYMTFGERKGEHA